MISELTTYGCMCDVCERELPRVHATEDAARSFAEAEGWVSRGFEILCPECVGMELESSTWRLKAMLVLTRRQSQKIFVGPDITVTVVAVDSSGRVRIGIDAPQDVVILRDDAVNRRGSEGSDADANLPTL
jgi:carbon storage regulator